MQTGNDIVYLNGDYPGRDEASISPDDRGFIFADGAYEVARSYYGRLFELESHIDRLKRSLSELSITGFDASLLAGISNKLIDMNNLSDKEATVYIQVTRGCAPRKHAFPVPYTAPTVYASSSLFAPPVEERKNGAGIILIPDDRWARCDIKSVSLLPNILAKQKATDAGAEEAIFVRDGEITEGSASNFAAVFSGSLVTHQDSNRILAGITKKVVIELCSQNGINIEERPIKKEELVYADEMLLLSTTREIMPVVRFDGNTVSDGKPGPVTRKLQRLFDKYIKAANNK